MSLFSNTCRTFNHRLGLSLHRPNRVNVISKNCLCSLTSRLNDGFTNRPRPISLQQNDKIGLSKMGFFLHSNFRTLSLGLMRTTPNHFRPITSISKPLTKLVGLSSTSTLFRPNDMIDRPRPICPNSSLPRFGLGFLNQQNIQHMSTSEKDESLGLDRMSIEWHLKNKKNQLKETKEDFIEGIQDTKDKVKKSMGDIVKRENIWTIPNLLCISRIVASPVLLWLVISSNYSVGLILFICAGFTDLLDGAIARRFPSQASTLGSFLDPLADKIFVSSLFLGLTYQGLIPLLLTSLIIYRDFAIIGGACYVRYASLPPPKTIPRYFDATHATAQLAPTTISKMNTGVQLILITAALSAPIYSFQDHYVFQALIAITAVTTLASGISYITSNDTYHFINKNLTDKPMDKNK